MSTQESTSHTHAQRSRPVLLLGITLVAITAALFLYGSVFTSVSYEVNLEPQTLFAGQPVTASLTLFGVNRLGGRVPFSSPRFRIAIEEGEELIRAEAAGDSTRFTLRTVGVAGTVTLYCYTDEWPFPMIATLRIVAPLAHAVFMMRIDA